jgi:hypothetical protein
MSKSLSVITIASFLVLSSASLVFAQAGSESGATGAKGPSTATGSQTSTPPGMVKNGTAAGGNGQQSATDGKTADCPPGMARMAAADGTKGSCRTTN